MTQSKDQTIAELRIALARSEQECARLQAENAELHAANKEAVRRAARAELEAAAVRK